MKKVAEKDSPRTYAIWWTTNKQAHAIDTTFGKGEGALEIIGAPPYISSEINNRVGRSGRGRLWINQDQFHGVAGLREPWNYGHATAKIIQDGGHGGIWLHRADVKFVITLRGFVTDLDLNPLHPGRYRDIPVLKERHPLGDMRAYFGYSQEFIDLRDVKGFNITAAALDENEQ